MNQNSTNYFIGNEIYLSKTHLPYFILALAMSFIFNIVPLLLLCLYPCRCFQTCLNRTGLQHQALHTFMDAFQGCYKPKAYNFSALYFFAQILNMATPSILGVLQYHSFTSYLLMGIVMLLGIARPYRNKWHNVINITLFTSMFIFYFALITSLELIYFHDIHNYYSYHRFNTTIYIIMVCIPPLYGFFLFLRAVTPSKLKKKITTVIMTKREDSDYLHDRLVADEECTPLINH